MSLNVAPNYFMFEALSYRKNYLKGREKNERSLMALTKLFQNGSFFKVGLSPLC